MHPLVARIHPSYRTALTAWLFARTICWSVSLRTGWGATPLLNAPSTGAGTPLWAAWLRICRRLEVYELWNGVDAGTGLAVVGGEVALLASAVAIYRFVRRDELPQTAERATWLWVLAPSMGVTVPASSWNFALLGASVGLAALGARRFGIAAAAVAVAVGFRVEALLLWPGFVWYTLESYRPGKDSGAGLWAAAFGPLAAFTATVASAMLLAGEWGVSVRSLHPASTWRTDFEWNGLAAEAPLLAVSSVVLIGLVLLLRSVRRDRGRALVAAAPALAWPLLHDPVSEACGALLLAIPAFGVLARHLEDPSRERPAMVAAATGLALWLV